jgi:hypothetical protein
LTGKIQGQPIDADVEKRPYAGAENEGEDAEQEVVIHLSGRTCDGALGRWSNGVVVKPNPRFSYSIWSALMPRAGLPAFHEPGNPDAAFVEHNHGRLIAIKVSTSGVGVMMVARMKMSTMA